MLTIFRRHRRTCPHISKGRDWRKCNCPIHMEGYLGDDYIRESLSLRSWDAAQAKVRELEADSVVPKKEEKEVRLPTIAEAVEKFLVDAKARNLADSTLKKLKLLLEKQLAEFAKNKGFLYLKDLDVDALREFRSTWKDSPITAVKKLERLRGFFRFCQEPGWIKANPATGIKPPKVTDPPTLPFTKDEMEKILWACDLFSTKGIYRARNRSRVHAMVLLLRHSGLRIRDAVCLSRDRIQEGKLFLYTQKTGTLVHLPLPPVVTAALDELDQHSARFFWNGEGKVESAVGVWERTLKRLFEIAGIQGGHPHRFRDTFAVALLENGVTIEDVSILLGHKDIRITQKHYSPWVRSRQIRLEENVRAAWVSAGT